MKRVLNHPPREKRPGMWRSMGELEGTPEFEESLSREFPEGAQYYEESGLTRRDFLRLMGASTALAGVGLAGCRRPEALLVPFTKSVEWTVPGKFLYYATSMPGRQGAQPLVISTVDGRPTKVEGNPLHPASGGGTNGFAQASILDLYDPFRSREFVHNGAATDAAAWDAHLAEIRNTYLANQGTGLAFLSEANDSPTLSRLRAMIREQFPNALWAEYEPWGRDDRVTRAAFGEGVRLIPRLENADVILALDSDFLNSNENGLSGSNGFYQRRSPDQSDKPMNRLYAVESYYTSTGGLADHRLRARQTDMLAITAAFAEKIAAGTNNAALKGLLSALPKQNGDFADSEWITECAKDLLTAQGKSLVLTRPQQSAAMQFLVHGINEALGNHGKTVEAVSVPAEPPAATISELADAMRPGQVQTLFVLGGNPAYNAPADLDFASLLDQVPDSVRLGIFPDETSKLSKWHLPAAHYLESWGDGRAFDGTYTAVQPMILPLYGGLTESDILAPMAGQPKAKGSELINETFRQIVGEAGASDAAWNEFLRTGFVPDSAFRPADIQFNASAGVEELQKAVPTPSQYELVFQHSSSVDDGRYANNSWLLETPDFVTKLTWDNALLVSPTTAKKLGIASGDMLEVSAGNQAIEVAALIAPGQADDSFSLALGYGRKDVSALMENVGFNAYPLRSAKNARFLPGVEVRPVGRKYTFAFTQEHASMEGRDLAREGTLDTYKADPGFAGKMGMDSHIPPNISLYKSPPLTANEQWAMTVDLNTCSGCNACLLACQAENNVPVVGKEQVYKNREMAWIRIDRWFAGDENDPEMLAQAVMCQHCENAPCETVCPVNATVHSEDGLNLMAYNRCIGTRYCANNCPWKVRRFNFFDYNERPIDKLYFGPVAKKGMAESLKMAKNPNVTVRMRGVMEKCTFCIQRIEEAKIGRLVKAGASDSRDTPIAPFQTACQQACPNDSIVFGNERDPESKVAKLRNSARGYVTLKYLNTRPRVTYLARIKNPNPSMPGASRVGHINTAHHGGHHDDEHGHALPSGSHAHDADHNPPANHGGHH